MTFAEAKTAVQYYLGTTSDVSQCVKDSIRALSNFFWVDDVNTSLSTVIGQTAYSLPTETLSLYSLVINGQEYREILLSDPDAWTDAVEVGTYRFYATVSQFVLSVAPKAVYQISLRRRRAFAVPSSDGEVLEIPTRLIDLMILGAVQRFWRKIVAQSSTTRELLPDVTPKEAAAALTSITAEYDAMLRIVR